MAKKTKIPLKDGVHFDGRQINQITLRRIYFTDTWFAPDLGTMPGAMTFMSRLSKVPFEALSLMTQADAHSALEALSAHVEKYLAKRGR